MLLNMTLRNLNATNFLAALDAAATPGYFKFYNDPQPANVETAITTQTLLATLVMSDPAATILDGVLTFSAITEDLLADADGVCTWARAYDGDDNEVADFTVGLAASAEDLKFNDVNFVQDGPVRLNSVVITF